MSRFSILLIENRIIVSGKIVSTLGQCLHSFTLSITKGFKETIATPEPVQVVLVDLDQITDKAASEIGCLRQAYPDLPIMLLVPPAENDQEDKLLAALKQGASDYFILSEAGLLSLGRWLAQEYEAWQAPNSVQLLVEEINQDSSQLVMQLIDLEYRVRAWNKSAEILFKVRQEQVVDCFIDELPLSQDHLTRLKDIIDQMRAVRRLFLFHFICFRTNGLIPGPFKSMFIQFIASPEGKLW